MWADAELMAREYLAEIMPFIPISTAVPNPRPERFIRLMSSGSRRRTLVHRDSRVTIECWDASGEAAACQLAEEVYHAIDQWDLVPDFDGWDGGPYPQPDPHTGTPRYVMTCIVRHRTSE